jgi:hypothetical protein
MPELTPPVDQINQGPVLGVEGELIKAVFLLPEVTLVWTMSPDRALKAASTLIALVRQISDDPAAQLPQPSDTTAQAGD